MSMLCCNAFFYGVDSAMAITFQDWGFVSKQYRGISQKQVLSKLSPHQLMQVLHQRSFMDASVREAAMLMYRYCRKQCLEEQQLCIGEARRQMNTQFEQVVKAVGSMLQSEINSF